MRFYYDTEFLEDGRTIELISIGIVAEDGRQYYAVNKDAPWKRIKKHPWLMENVVPGLPRGHGDRRLHMPASWLVDFADPLVKPRSAIADGVRKFLLGDNHPDELPHVELWAWYAAYDHVALAQLWGRMIDLPEGIPMWTNDLQQECERLGNPTVPRQADGLHNALFDARHAREIGEFLRGQDELRQLSEAGWSRVEQRCNEIIAAAKERGDLPMVNAKQIRDLLMPDGMWSFSSEQPPSEWAAVVENRAERSAHDCPGLCGGWAHRHQYACADCWARLPEQMQQAISDTYKGDLREHVMAMLAAKVWYRDQRRTNCDSCRSTAKENAMITAKVTCTRKDVSGEGDDRYADVTFGPDYADGRNKEWAVATPGLSLQMRLNGAAADLFEAGRPYTLQFVESDD